MPRTVSRRCRWCPSLRRMSDRWTSIERPTGGGVHPCTVEKSFLQVRTLVDPDFTDFAKGRARPASGQCEHLGEEHLRREGPSDLAIYHGTSLVIERGAGDASSGTLRRISWRRRAWYLGFTRQTP
jgi:hypothetical protein